MRRFLATFIVATLISASSAAPVFAEGRGGHYYGRGGGFDPFWPIAAALTIPAAIIGTVAQITVPGPAVYGYAAPPAPVVYSRPVPYYAPRPYYAPTRVYVVPRGYYAPRGYYPTRDYRE